MLATRRHPRQSPRARLLTALVLLAALATCAPRVEPAGPEVGTPSLAPGAFVAADGARLALRVWPANPETRAVVVAVHGFNDYSNAFTDPAAWWSGHGIATYAYDQRGFGESPHPGVWAGAETLARDLAQVVAAVRARHPGVPLYLLGESMGGAVAIVALAEGLVDGVDGVILAAPAVWGADTLNPFYRATLWLAAHSFPAKRLSGRGLGIRASDNDEMLRALGRDPLVIKGSRVDTLYGLVRLMDQGLQRSPEVSAPLLILYGANDEVIPEGATRRLLERVAAPHRVLLYPEGWHMLLRDLQAETVWEDVRAWIEDRDRALPSGHERQGAGALPDG
ncbi:MAG: lysophospholipase [Alphaproteobacteria bacterium]